MGEIKKAKLFSLALAYVFLLCYWITGRLIV